MQHHPRSRLVAAAALIVSSVWGLPALAGEGTTFRDTFDRFDQERWYVSDGWTNGDYQNCNWSNRAINLRDGKLRLSFAYAPSATRKYICAEVQTKTEFSYGTFEASVRTGKGSGLNAAFFTYIGPEQSKPHDEIDFEVLTRDTAKVSLNTYVSGEPKHGRSVGLPRRTDSTFNTYSFIWEKDRLRWFVNSKLVHEATGNDLPLNPQRIFFSHWGSDTFTDWMGPFAPPPRPLVMEVDWVSYTAPDQVCQFPESVLCTLD